MAAERMPTNIQNEGAIYEIYSLYYAYSENFNYISRGY